MKNIVVIAGIISLAVGLSGCGVLPSTQQSEVSTPAKSESEAKSSIATESSKKPSATQTSSPTPPTSRTEVVWADYDPGTQSEIDRMTITGDCLGINSFFGMATATEEKVNARTGHGNEALTKYLYEALEIAKCN